MELRSRSRAQPPSPASRPDGSDTTPSPGTSIPTTPPSPTVNLRSLFLFFLAFRLINALVTRTFFQPDEHYQTTEIAHRVVFGHGFKSWEWSTNPHSFLPANASWFQLARHNVLNGPVRSILHPLLFVPSYALLKVTGLDQTYLLLLFPRLQQAVIAAIGDWFTFRLAHRIGGERFAWFATLVGLTNLYGLYTATRTFSNCTEAAVTVAGLFYWPFKPFYCGDGAEVEYFATKKEHLKLKALGKKRQEKGKRNWQSQEDLAFEQKQLARAIYDRTLKRSLWLAAGACLLRPTNGVFWVYLVAELFVKQLRCLRFHKSSRSGEGERSLLPTLEIIGETASFIRILTLIGLTGLSFALVVDTTYDYLSNASPHNRPFLPALSLVAFLHKNVVSNLSIFYGANSWHWYWTQGLPVLCTVWLPASVFGLIDAMLSVGREGRGGEEKKSLARLVLVIVGVYSLLGHKEFRFLQPLLPVLSVLAASGLAVSYASEGGAAGQVESERKGGVAKQLWRAINILPLWLRAVLLTLQPVAAIYLASIHGVAQEQVPYELGRIYRQQQRDPVGGESEEFGTGFGRIHNLGFLMPCHSTPWATHLHSKDLVDRSWFIQCPPPPAQSEMTQRQKGVKYWDQSDFFYHDPIKYLVERMPFNVDTSYPPSPVPGSGSGTGEGREEVWDKGWRHTWPSHLVVFDALLKEGSRKAGHTRTLKNLLSLKGYREVGRYWNTVKHEDARREGDVVVLAYKGPKTHK
ncbi:hypothetical protein NDA18_004104 [Ustilago nuda]|nr:hypothetical protein NDA18_004104 [Ustilago nuda]